MNDERPKPVKPVGELVEDLVRRLGLSARAKENRVFEVWSEAAGPAVANHARPVMISDGQLVVNVMDSVWLQEIQFMKAELKKRLNQALGGAVIRDIRLRQGPLPPAPQEPVAPAQDPEPNEQLPPGDPRVEEARRATQIISDPALRAIMFKVLTRKPPRQEED